MNKSLRIKTPKSHPNHDVVGHYYAGYSYETSRTEIYFCDSYDPRQGYWMTNVNCAEDRKNISERAIGGTYMEAHDQGETWWVTRWYSRIKKSYLIRAV